MIPVDNDLIPKQYKNNNMERKKSIDTSLKIYLNILYFFHLVNYIKLIIKLNFAFISLKANRAKIRYF
ncbi:MAG: hypothetical protein C0168_00095 [Candidatus Aminicenantes bacterium]|nr:MAG: hypothetical protein C0168_00095 [Candidatus Aminicenantes bacterium]